MRIICRPLMDWPGQLRLESDRKEARFTATWTDTQNLLVREADMLKASEIVIQLAVPESQIRADGWPYARATPRHSGVTVVLPETRQGRLSWSTDRYTDSRNFVSARVKQARKRYEGDGEARGGLMTFPGWQCNVRAIAVSMQALRAADRHGIMQGRQYAGFKELGSGIAMGSGSQMTVEEAARFLAERGRLTGRWTDLIDNEEIRERCYRAAVKRWHPDAGGDSAEFMRLKEANTILDGVLSKSS